MRGMHMLKEKVKWVSNKSAYFKHRLEIFMDLNRSDIESKFPTSWADFQLFIKAFVQFKIQEFEKTQSF